MIAPIGADDDGSWIAMDRWSHRLEAAQHPGDGHVDDEQRHGLYDDAGVTTALGAAIMKTTTPSIEGGEPPRGNAHDVSERGRAIMRRLKARAAAKGLPAPDLTGDLDLRRRIYRAARRIEDARVRRGDTRPFLLDEEPAVTATP